MHTCNLATPEPHEGGLITGPGCPTVMIGGLCAAVEGDLCICNGPPNAIIGGSSTVLIGGRPAAREGDATAHGGKIVTGCRTVLIGGMAVITAAAGVGAVDQVFTPALRKPHPPDPVPASRDRDIKEKSVVCNRALKKVRELLREKLKLLESNDPKTLKLFKKWFLADDEEAKQVIVDRIKKALEIAERMTDKNFITLIEDGGLIPTIAEVDPKDKTYTIGVGKDFWTLRLSGRKSKAGTIIHELSHFKDVGRTKDFAYNVECLSLDPKDALYNADSFEFFMMGFKRAPY